MTVMAEFDCNYCEKNYSQRNEITYLNHLVDSHKQQLSMVDERHVKQSEEVDMVNTSTAAALALQSVVLVLLSGVVVYLGSIIFGYSIGLSLFGI